VERALSSFRKCHSLNKDLMLQTKTMNPASSFLLMHIDLVRLSVNPLPNPPAPPGRHAIAVFYLHTSRETNSMKVKSDDGSAASKFRSFSSSFDSNSTEEKAVIVGPPWPGHYRGLGRPLDDASASILGSISPQCAQFDCILGWFGIFQPCSAWVSWKSARPLRGYRFPNILPPKPNRGLFYQNKYFSHPIEGTYKPRTTACHRQDNR